MHLCSTLLTYLPAFSPHESRPVNVEVLKKICEQSDQKNFHGLTNPKMLPPALNKIVCGLILIYSALYYVLLCKCLHYYLLLPHSPCVVIVVGVHNSVPINAHWSPVCVHSIVYAMD